MPEPTPEAWAQIRHDYEHTDQPLAHICAEHGLSIPTMRYCMKRWEWRRRKPLIPREGPPPVDPPVIAAAASGFRARTFGASWNDGEDHPALPPPGEHDDAAAIVPRLHSAVARILPAIEATIARLAEGPQRPRDMEQAGRALSSLIRALRELNALLAEHKAREAEDADNAIPQDMDAFREELAQRLFSIIDKMERKDEEAKPAET